MGFSYSHSRLQSMGAPTEFRVAIKSSATAANEAVRTLTDERGDVLHFDSREAAEAEAARLSERGTAPLGIQEVAPQDPTDVDAYLVSIPERRTHTPLESVDGRHTFETTAKQYGALGEVLILSYQANPPALVEYVRSTLVENEIDYHEDRLRLELDRNPDPVVFTRADTTSRLSWIPDCVVRATVDGAVLDTYWCEIKTGDASFQRDQPAVMAYKACEAPVLKIRVDLSALPDRYTVRIEAVAAEEPPEELANLQSPDARLDEFS